LLLLGWLLSGWLVRRRLLLLPALALLLPSLRLLLTAGLLLPAGLFASLSPTTVAEVRTTVATVSLLLRHLCATVGTDTPSSSGLSAHMALSVWREYINVRYFSEAVSR
jgi:hypothetical protein